MTARCSVWSSPRSWIRPTRACLRRGDPAHSAGHEGALKRSEERASSRAGLLARHASDGGLDPAARLLDGLHV
jgi:hypothetical protein